MRKHKTKFIVGIAVGLIVVAFLLPKIPLFQTEAKDPGSPRARQSTPVKATVLHPDTLYDRVVTTGTVLANEEVELRSETAGKITGIYFKEGEPVSEGDLLVKTNDAELRAQLLKLEQQRKLAEEQEYRQRKLLEKEAVSQEAYDETLNRLKNLEAELQLTRARLEKTEIRAPFDGIIGLRQVSIGDYISPQDKITTIQDINPIKIEFSIPEKYASRVRTNAPIQFTTSSTAAVHRGTLYAIEPKIDPATRTLQMRARANNEGGNILPGAFAEVDLILEEIPNTLLLPTEALIPEFQEQRVYLVRNGKVVPRTVQTGIRTADRIQIRDGLTARDTVVTAGILQLSPGATVTIQELSD